MSGEEKGVGQCAFDPRHNSTYVFSGESQAYITGPLAFICQSV